MRKAEARQRIASLVLVFASGCGRGVWTTPEGAGFTVAMPASPTCVPDSAMTVQGSLVGRFCSAQVKPLFIQYSGLGAMLLGMPIYRTYGVASFRLHRPVSNEAADLFLDSWSHGRIDALTKEWTKPTPDTKTAASDGQGDGALAAHATPEVVAGAVRRMSLAGEGGVEFEVQLRGFGRPLRWTERAVLHEGKVYELFVSGVDVDASRDVDWLRMIDTLRFVPN